MELGKQSLGIFKNNMQLLGNQTTISPQLITYSIPAVAIEKMRSRGGNALGINVKGHLVSRSHLLLRAQQPKVESMCSNDEIVNLLSVSWTSVSDDGTAHAFATRFMASYKDAVEGFGVFHPFVYINYANQGQDVFSGYGEENKQRLIAIQTRVDPLGIFTSSGLWRGFFKVR